MAYQESGGRALDLSSSGRGLQQTLLLLAHLYADPATVLLLDEPDAHLEILRQRQTYNLLTEIAQSQGSQIVAASHSEVVLNEAADRDVVVAFVGRPHRVDDRGSQVLKALRDIGFDHYYQAEQKEWVLYVEGSPDVKATDDFLDPLFRSFFGKLNLPLTLRKSDYHVLAALVPVAEIDSEVTQKLDAIAEVASRATPECG